ncbi:hypothetical protein ES707_01312 [subsurface metagenome]
MTEQEKDELADLIENYEGTITDGVEQIITFFKEANYVRLADDQSLPEAILSVLGLRAVNATVKILNREGWRKVEL